MCNGGNQEAQHHCYPSSAHASHFRKSIWSLLEFQNSYVPMSFLLNLGLKSTSTLTEACCWSRSCCQWSIALLEICRSSSISRSWHIWASVPWDTPFTNPDMWTTNGPDLSPVDYHILSEASNVSANKNSRMTFDCKQC